jgi:aminoglycoside phosphotransferase (APT) family kinase protein
LPLFDGAPVWLHADLHPANLIVREGRLAAVIDFGDLTSGDLAIDVSVAWMIWEPDARESLRAGAGAGPPTNDVTWARARGWALSLAVAYLAHSAGSPWMARLGRQTIAAVLADL